MLGRLPVTHGLRFWPVLCTKSGVCGR
ncbi:TPA: hypothetical protein DHW62_02800 [candidate division WWE3 bacterium]|uniref:Uncharacterized protein n=1 Tax=candidate division WWE3 bacterium TaxID=2053526 RepID=A0A656PNK5_UNCKA|nr:hypothetical protein [candidate division WWE3 bacterium]HBL00759.1 hypothetical protein [candidate division WWE3 bacterium]HBT66155.1 hypothetical protein [candidate division WWE3 bacterium]HCE36294.1 hypothetical protein [candidate division WWE3 bacterium]HCL95829.1 hypothetical protein [candidate division WWE3 bacterium]